MNKTALITGASSGIGEAFAHYYAEQKYNLVLVARSESKLKELKKQFKAKYGVETLVVLADLTEEYRAKKVYEVVEQAKVRVDVLVNNAGFATRGDFDQVDLIKQHQEIMLNVTAVADMCHFFSQQMVKRGEGTIINVASSSAYHPIPTMGIYAATKAFVLSFTEALHVEMKNKGVHVIAISPGATNTNFFDAGGGVAYGTLRTPAGVVETTMKGLRKGKVSIIDGANNFFTSGVLPRVRTRKGMANMVGNIMRKQEEK